MQSKVPEILRATAKTFEERNHVYGDNHKRLGGMLRAAFPKGITLVTALDHERFALFVLIMVKLSRYAVQWEDGHKDSIHDAVVYCAMLEAIDDYRNQHGQRRDQWDARDAAE